MFSKDDIHNVANLARIKLSESEEESLAGDIDNILEYIGQINTVEVSQGGPRVGVVHNVFRDDGTPHETGIHTEVLMKEAPDKKEGYVKVKKIL